MEDIVVRVIADEGTMDRHETLGNLTVDKDVDSVHALRRQAGNDIRIMVNAKEAYDSGTAISVSRRVTDADVSWFEEPTPSRAIEDKLLITMKSIEKYEPFPDNRWKVSFPSFFWLSEVRRCTRRMTE